MSVYCWVIGLVAALALSIPKVLLSWPSWPRSVLSATVTDHSVPAGFSSLMIETFDHLRRWKATSTPYWLITLRREGGVDLRQAPSVGLIYCHHTCQPLLDQSLLHPRLSTPSRRRPRTAEVRYSENVFPGLMQVSQLPYLAADIKGKGSLFLFVVHRWAAPDTKSRPVRERLYSRFLQVPKVVTEEGACVSEYLLIGL